MRLTPSHLLSTRCKHFYIITHPLVNNALGVVMESVEICFEINEKIENALNSGCNHLYVNVDDLENGLGFLRVLCRQKSEYINVYEGTFALNICLQVLDLLEKSDYDIVDFTDK